MKPEADEFVREELDACPYLRTASGFTFGRPARDHRCDVAGARGEGIQLRREKQVSLCLRASHVECEFYAVAQAMPRRRAAADGARRRIVSTAPVLVAGPPAFELGSRAEPHERVPASEARKPPRRQVGRRGGLRRVPHIAMPLAILGAAAAIVVALGVAAGLPARWSLTAATQPPAPSFGTAVASLPATPQPTLSAAPSASPDDPETPLPTAPEVASPSPVPSPIPTPVPSPSATPGRTPFTYVVQPGDTLGAIAARFHTTAAAIQAANGMGTSTMIYAGQSLIIP